MDSPYAIATIQNTPVVFYFNGSKLQPNVTVRTLDQYTPSTNHDNLTYCTFHGTPYRGSFSLELVNGVWTERRSYFSRLNGTIKQQFENPTPAFNRFIRDKVIPDCIEFVIKNSALQLQGVLASLSNSADTLQHKANELTKELDTTQNELVNILKLQQSVLDRLTVLTNL